MDGEALTYIGKTDFRNKLTKFGIKDKDRAKHMYIIGKTGTGKSTFLENLIVQDIQNGNGVAFIDPHGSSADKLLDYIPEWRKQDVIYFNPSDTDFPIAFNPLEDLGPERRHLVADGLMTVFEKIWPEAFSGRMTYILNNTMLALLEYPEPSMLGINRMLTDKDFRKKVVANVKDPAVKNAWDELLKWDDKRWSEAISALVNKVGQLTTNPVIRNVVGQTKSTFDFRKAMDERKIIIINLSKGLIGEQNAPLIGAMLITKIYLAAMSRAELPDNVLKQSAPFYFYVDEFQNFANDSFANILSEARKYRLSLTVANQYIAQMEETVRDAVFGNMGSTFAFRVGPLDAEFMERVFAPVFNQEDLQNIAFAQMYLTLQIDGMGSKPFSAKALDPIPPLTTSLRQEIVELSRQQFARPRAEVENTINDWFGLNKAAVAGQTMTDRNVPRKDPARVVHSMDNKSLRKEQENKRFDPTVFDQRTAKPLPEISGYKKKDSMPKKEAPKTSDALKDLLGKLDTELVAQEKEVPAQIKPVAPVRSEPIIEKPKQEEVKPVVQQKPEPVTVKPVPRVAQAPQKPLARAASPEKKNALAEALARAMAGNKQEKIEKQEDKKTEPSIVIPKEESISESIPKTAPEPVVPQKAQPQMDIPPRKESVYQTKTPREVPEDILRRVLE